MVGEGCGCIVDDYNVRIAEEEEMRVVCDRDKLATFIKTISYDCSYDQYDGYIVDWDKLSDNIIANLPLWVKIVSDKGEL